MSDGYSPLRRWLRQERVRDLEASQDADNRCSACNRELYRMDERGNLIGSHFEWDGFKECWSCWGRPRTRADREGDRPGKDG